MNIQIYSESPNCCKQCSKNLSYEKKDNKFCSSSCSAIYNNNRRGNYRTEESKREQGRKVKGSLRTLTKEEYFIINNRNVDKKYGKKKLFLVNCFRCQKEFEIEEREFQFPKKEKYFCSSFCSHSKHSTLKNKKKEERVKKEKVFFDCLLCGQKTKNKKFCSYEHKFQYKRLMFSIKKQYILKTEFKFSIWNFKNEFNFELIKKLGWYSPINHKSSNPNGVSRDHIYSVSQGFKNNINPFLLSHPANCRIIVHIENRLKRERCDITFEDLLEKIKNWDIKYGNFYKNNELENK